MVDVFFDRSADHQKLNVIQKQTFYFLAEGLFHFFESIDQPPIIRSWK